MEIEKIVDKKVLLNISIEELETISNALNEVCNALSLDEFQTRMGVTMEEAEMLLSKVSAILDQI